MQKISESWKDIRGSDGLYKISNKGKVYSVKSNKFLSQTKNHKGYFLVTIFVHGVRKTITVHRLVADAFLENPNNYPQINHKDEDKTNNNVENLEWCTCSYNVKYGNGYLKRKEKKSYLYAIKATKKKVIQMDKNFNIIHIWDSISDAGRTLGINISDISNCCLKRKYRHTAGGYRWSFVQEE